MPTCQIKPDEDKGYSFCRKIYEGNHLRMLRIALGILKHQMDAENAVNDAFVSIIENYKKYSRLSAEEMSSLCIAIARNICIDILRRKEHLSGKDIEELVLNLADEDSEPEHYVMRQEQGEIV